MQFVRLSLETIFFQLSPPESFSFLLLMLLLEKMMERLIRAKKKCAGSSSYASTLYYISILLNNESFAALALLACFKSGCQRVLHLRNWFLWNLFRVQFFIPQVTLDEIKFIYGIKVCDACSESNFFPPYPIIFFLCCCCCRCCGISVFNCTNENCQLIK